jgi:hypothetical protein
MLRYSSSSWNKPQIPAITANCLLARAENEADMGRRGDEFLTWRSATPAYR